MKSALVTGGTGLIGLALIDYLASHEIPTTVIVRPESSRVKNILKDKNIRIVEGNIRDIGLIYELPWRVDAFFHLEWNTASREIVADPELQSQGIQRTLSAVKLASELKCSVFIGAGSHAEYGRVNGNISEFTPTNPETAYGISKLAAGRLSRIMCERMGIRHCWARILSVYGPHDKPSAGIMYLINTLLDGKSPSLTSCEQTWDYLHARDCAKALFVIAEKGENGSSYPVGSGKSRPIKHFFWIVRDEIAPSILLGFAEKQGGQVTELSTRISELTRVTGFQPEIEFIDGIRETIAWCRSQRRA